jgi:phosphonate transport system ATP-binding protein
MKNDSSAFEYTVEIKHASKQFGAKTRALSDVTLNIHAGERVALLGASGSGKSTLLRAICGLELLDGASSEVRLGRLPIQAGGVLAKDCRQARLQVGIIFQQFNLVGRMSVMNNVLAGMLAKVSLWRSLTGNFTQNQRLQALDALDSVGLLDQSFQRASTLSGGQQQRAAVARAIVQGAKILLADEPVASLDPESSRKVMELLVGLNRDKGVTLVISLHNIALARKYCTRIIALKSGVIVYDGAANDLDTYALRSIYGSQSDELTALQIDDQPSNVVPFNIAASV